MPKFQFLQTYIKAAVVSIYRPGSNNPSLSQNDQFSQATDFFYNLLNDLSDDVCTFGDLKIEDMLFLFGMLQDVQINLPPLLIIVLLHPILALWNMLIRFILNYIYTVILLSGKLSNLTMRNLSCKLYLTWSILNTAINKIGKY